MAKGKAPKKPATIPVSNQSLQTFVSPAPELFRSLQEGDMLGLRRFMENPGDAIAEGITGLFKAEQGVMARLGAVAGGVVQGVLQGRFYKQLGQELDDLRAEGKIAPDPSTKPYGWESWRQVFEAIDQDPIDDEKFEALKAMFYDINRVTSNESDCILSYQLLKLARRLSAGELLLLKAIYITNKRSERGTSSISENWTTWAARINNHYGHGPVALIRLNEKILVECELLSSRYQNDNNQVMVEYNRLTDLGMRFCKNLEGYERVTKKPEVW